MIIYNNKSLIYLISFVIINILELFCVITADFSMACYYKGLLQRTIKETGNRGIYLYIRHNVAGLVRWQIQPIAQTDGERAAVPLPSLVAMVREEVKCVERQPL